MAAFRHIRPCACSRCVAKGCVVKLRRMRVNRRYTPTARRVWTSGSMMLPVMCFVNGYFFFFFTHFLSLDDRMDGLALINTLQVHLRCHNYQLYLHVCVSNVFGLVCKGGFFFLQCCKPLRRSWCFTSMPWFPMRETQFIFLAAFMANPLFKFSWINNLPWR